MEAYQKVYLYRRIVQAKCFIDNNYASPIDVGNIADEAYFSKFHFIRLFKKIYGKTPHQYLVAVRMDKAMQLLQAGKPVWEVCLAVGFESLGSFSVLFKRCQGMSPSVYAAQQQSLKAAIARNPLAFVPSCFAYQHGWIADNSLEEVL